MSRRAICYRVPVGFERVVQKLQGDWKTTSHSLRHRQVTYYDTFDWRLFSRKLQLFLERSRTHVRLVLTSDDGRIIGQAPASRKPGLGRNLPPGPLGRRVAGIIDVRRLLPLVTLRDSGSELAILDGEEKTVARIALRAGTVHAHGRKSGAVTLSGTVVVAPVQGYEKTFDRLKAYFDSWDDLEPAKASELEVLLRAIGRVPGDYSSKLSVELAPSTPAVQAACRIAGILADTMARNQEGVRRDLDPEFLHDLRVAVRRTRSLIDQLPRAWPGDEMEHYQQELKWLGEVTGPTRDLDVFLFDLSQARSAMPGASAGHLTPLLDFLTERRSQEFRALKQALESSRFRGFLREWRAFLGHAQEADAHSVSISELASRRIRKTFRKVIRRGKKVGDRNDGSDLHRLRIECKRLRYLVEFFRSLYDPAAMKQFINSLKSLQDILGGFNDCSVQIEMLLSCSTEMDRRGMAPPETLVAVGVLLETVRRKQEQIREQFSAEFARFAEESRMRELHSSLLREGSRDTSP